MKDISYDIDPNHLKIHELNYELRIRGVNAGKADVPQKRKFLRIELRKDQARPDVQYEVPNFNFETESTEIKDSYGQISELVSDFDGTNYDVYKRICSRLNHLLARVIRIPNNIAEEVSGFRGDYLIMTSSLADDAEETMETHRQGERVPVQQAATANPSGKSYPIHKWSLKYDGTNNKCSVNSFLEQIEELSYARNISKEELFRSAVELFTGQALIWYRHTRTKCDSWDELVNCLRRDFLPPRHDRDLKEQISARKQGADEPIVIYIAAMENLFSRLIVKVPAKERLEIIRDNLLPDYQMPLALQNITSIDQLTQVCRSLEEANELRKKMVFQQPRKCVVEAVEPDLECKSSPSTSKHLGRKIDNRKEVGSVNEVRCFRCRQPGHVKRDCSQPKGRPYCYGCGKSGVIRTSCNHCSKVYGARKSSRVWRRTPPLRKVRRPQREASDVGHTDVRVNAITSKSARTITPCTRTYTSNKVLQGKTSVEEWTKWKWFVRDFYKTPRIIEPPARRSVPCNTTDGEDGNSGRSSRENGDIGMEANMVLVKKEQDNRPYINIKIFGTKVVALLDTGATRSIFGAKGLSLLEKFGLKTLKAPGLKVSTADGAVQQVAGYVNLPVQVRNVVRVVEVLVIPSLAQTLILGSDFCETFGIMLDYNTATYFIGAEQDELDCVYNGLSICEIESKKVIQSTSDLTEEQRNQLEDLKRRFKEVSWMSGTKLGRTNAIEHKIDTGSAEPVKQRHHNMSPYMLEHLGKELDRMLSLGVVRPSNSPWASPVLLVKKRDGEMRFCFDGRKLNNLTKKDAYPLPHIDHILSRLTGARYLSSIDLKSAFWQIPLEKSSCEKTAFVIPSRGLFEFTVMPFGLSNAAQTQQRLMDNVLGYTLEPFAFVYLDDVIIATPTFEKHVEVLNEVLERLKAANLTINLEKCEFCRPSLKYLGFLLDEGGLRTDPDKVAAMLNFPRPSTVTELKRFIGLVGWYRRFIPFYANLTAPITDLIKGKRKSQRIDWTDSAEESFKKIKEALVSAPILTSPNFSKQFTIQCDASDIGVGCVLTQENDKGQEAVIAFASRTLTAAERKYTATEKELIAILYATEKFRCYVEGVKFKVITDHYSLLWLHRLKDPCGRLARWAVKLQHYDMVIEHRKGALNVVPDALSRAPVEVCVIAIDRTAAEGDPWYHKMMQNILDSPEKYPDWKLDAGVIYKHIPSSFGVHTNFPEWKIVIPKKQRLSVFQECHDNPLAAHLGAYKTVQRIRELYYWPKLLQDTKRYVNRCHVCNSQKVSSSARPGFMGQPKKVSFPWQYVSVDILGPLPRSRNGYTHVLMVLDYFTKFCILHPLRKATAPAIEKFLEEQVFLVYGAPEVLACDNGVQFTGHVFRRLADRYEVKIFYNARYHPQVNAVERVNRVLETAIRSYLRDNDHRRWDEEIHKIAFALRTAVHEATGFSPTLLNFGRYVPSKGSYYGKLGENEELDLNDVDRNRYVEDIGNLPNLFVEVRRHLQEAYEKNARTYNLRKRPADVYHVGDRVWKRNYVLSSAVDNFAAKLAPKFVLCTVKKVVSPLVYQLQGEDGKDVGRFHVKDLKPYRGTMPGDDEF